LVFKLSLKTAKPVEWCKHLLAKVVLQRKPFAFELFTVWLMRCWSHLAKKHLA